MNDKGMNQWMNKGSSMVLGASGIVTGRYYRAGCSRVLVHVVECLSECTHVHVWMRAHLRSRPAILRTEFLGVVLLFPCDPIGAPRLLSLWFNYCALRSARQPAVDCQATLQMEGERMGGVSVIQVEALPRRSFSFAEAKGRWKIGARSFQTCQDINQKPALLLP